MATDQSSGATAPRKPDIFARDRDGNEHMLGAVDHPAGFVTLYDKEMVRILAPGGAIALAVALIRATRGYYPGSGPISGNF